MLLSLYRAVILASLLSNAAVAAPPPTDPSVLRAVDERLRQIIVARDSAAMADIALPNLRVNAPINRVLNRDQLLAMMDSGEVAADQYQRFIEDIAISGDVGIVMGRETVVAPPSSASGRMFGTRPLERRFTNIYQWDGTRWRYLARHANVVTNEASPR